MLGLVERSADHDPVSPSPFLYLKLTAPHLTITNKVFFFFQHPQRLPYGHGYPVDLAVPLTFQVGCRVA